MEKHTNNANPEGGGREILGGREHVTQQTRELVGGQMGLKIKGPSTDELENVQEALSKGQEPQELVFTEGRGSREFRCLVSELKHPEDASNDLSSWDLEGVIDSDNGSGTQPFKARYNSIIQTGRIHINP